MGIFLIITLKLIWLVITFIAVQPIELILRQALEHFRVFRIMSCEFPCLLTVKEKHALSTPWGTV